MRSLCNNQRASALVLALLGGLAVFELANPMAKSLVEARSVLDNIPGSVLLLDLASNVANRIGKATQTAGPIGNNLGPCLRGTNGVCPPRDPDASRTVAEIIRSRGFKAEEHDVITRDGYILTVQRIVNPLIEARQRPRLKPVILQHGLMSPSVDWVINSVHVRPKRWTPRAAARRPVATRTRRSARTIARGDMGYAGERRSSNRLSSRSSPTLNDHPATTTTADSQEHPNALGFYMANEGYDVFLANSRGNIYGQRHTRMSPVDSKFWAFTFDEQIKYDLPDTASYIQNLTGHSKLGYVGHSQGTAMMLGLLSDRPEYADVFEPVVLLAPVSYTSNAISPAKYFSFYTPVLERANMMFASSNVAVTYLAPLVCKPELIKNEICANLVFLTAGFNAEELDMNRASAYLGHMPSGTSAKNLAHFGQGVLTGRFAHFGHGILGNQIQYGQTRAPDYKLGNIRSKSLVLFTADNDWLASPKDVAKLRADLRVAPLAVYNISEIKPKWNHIDFVYGKNCGELVNKRILEVFHHFD